MLAKFSVKKPLTVLVAVILVLILGFVSFTSMTPDLLPNMDFPMAVLMTTYPGASSEEVETTVTKPLEQSMATLENINAVTSSSGSKPRKDQRPQPSWSAADSSRKQWWSWFRRMRRA